MNFLLLIREFIEDIKTQKTRAFLTTIAISWGIIAVTLLMAFGEGLSIPDARRTINAGDRIIRVYNGQTTKKWEGLPIGRRIWLKTEDCKIIEENIPQVSLRFPVWESVHVYRLVKKYLQLLWKVCILILNFYVEHIMLPVDDF